LLSAAKLCEEFIADFEDVLTSHDEAVLNTNQASGITGYSRAQLLHLYKQGRLRGHKNGKHVFFRAGDLPRKPNGGRRAGRNAKFRGGRRGVAGRCSETRGEAGHDRESPEYGRTTIGGRHTHWSELPLRHGNREGSYL
jgi:hypothetical protein